MTTRNDPKALFTLEEGLIHLGGIVLFAGASSDNNAVHINEEFAATTIFKGRIAHGMLTASVISAATPRKDTLPCT